MAITQLSKYGEFGLIKHLTKSFSPKNSSTIKSIGDDAAVLNYQNSLTVVTTDLLVEGVHFDLTYTPLKHLGYKAVVVNLSDVYAMNAIPKHITVSVAVSSLFSVEMLEELYAGILRACEHYNVDLVGGDTSTSRKGLFISVTALGEVEKENVVYRNGAKENDLICVSGDLGGAYLGLQILEREKKAFENNPNIQPRFQGFDYILERQLKPEARKDVVKELKSLNLKPNAMIDISDGLSSEILHICEQSNVGCKIYEEKIPLDTQTINTAELFDIQPVTCALNGGEDYELLFTLPLSFYEKIKGNPMFSIIGHIVPKNEGNYLITQQNSVAELKAQGWNAYISHQ